MRFSAGRIRLGENLVGNRERRVGLAFEQMALGHPRVDVEHLVLGADFGQEGSRFGESREGLGDLVSAQ